MDAEELIRKLGLAPHPEGGWYRETWRDRGGSGSAIYFVLLAGKPSWWHRLHGRAELWHWYAGAPLRLDIRPGTSHTLGNDLADGMLPQAVVPPEAWQRAESLGPWTLVGATVSPAFEFAAFELAPADFDPGGPAPAPSNLATMVTTSPSGTTGGAGPAPSPASPTHNTLAIDIGGTGLKASVVDDHGHMEHARVRVDTPYPLHPDKLVTVLSDLVKGLPPYDRISVGFPGMVRGGHVLSAPHFVSPEGPGGKPTTKLTKAWDGYNLQAAISQAMGKPTKVANDADVQGAAVITGEGLELVITLGTGVGTALFYEGKLLPHLEFAHHPLSPKGSYNEVLGDDARKAAGRKKWNKKVSDMLDTMRALTFFDHCYIGGGNATKLTFDLPPDVSTVSNDAGITGGIKLWDVTD
jgi:polyphosphate glucokinase